MELEDQLEIMEETGETEAELIDQETELQDVEDDIDEYLGEDAEESDLEHAYDSFITENEMNYDGYDPSEVIVEEERIEQANILHSEGYHVVDRHDLEEELIEMEVEEGDIAAYLYDEDNNEIGFTLIDEDGNEQDYFYVDVDDYEIIDEDDPHTEVVNARTGEEFDLGISREGISEVTKDLNDISKVGREVASELKDTFDDISDSLGFLKK